MKVLSAISVLFFTVQISFSQTWIQRASIPGLSRTALSGCAFQGKGYVGFGLTGGSTNHNSIYEYDPVLNSWTQKNNYPGSARRGAIFLSNDSIIFAGLGTNGNLTYKDLNQYFPQTDSWSAKANYPGTGGHLAFAALIGNYIYVGGGKNMLSGQHRGDFWRYNITTNTWTDSITQFPFGSRTAGITFTFNNSVYFGLGHNGSSSFNDLWEYNVTTDQWARKADFPGIDRLNANIFISKGKAIVGGGYKLGGIGFRDYYEYDPTNNTWSILPTFSAGNRSVSAEFAINDIGYLVAGWDSTQSSISSVWSFKPLITSTKNQKISEVNWTIFPNPAKNNFTLNLENETQAIYTIYSITGEIMMRKNLNSKDSQIDCSTLAEGTYLIQVFTNGSSSTKKFIINR